LVYVINDKIGRRKACRLKHNEVFSQFDLSRLKWLIDFCDLPWGNIFGDNKCYLTLPANFNKTT